MATELEWKYAAPDAETLDRILADPALIARQLGNLQVYEMRSTYFDTPSRRLAELRFTLRRRMENQRSVLCVKAPLPCPEDPMQHGEWETDGADLPAALPELVAMGAPPLLLQAAEEGLIPVCGAAFRRRAMTLKLPDGSVCELACDLGVLFGTTDKEALCEVEVELKQGAPEQSRALALELCQRFGLSPQPRSKYSRARELG